MERRNAAPEQGRGNNERQGGVPYNRLAEDMAQPLADLQVPELIMGVGQATMDKMKMKPKVFRDLSSHRKDATEDKEELLIGNLQQTWLGL